MENLFQLVPLTDQSRVDGVVFSATLGDQSVVGTITRACLVRWAKSSNEPLVSIFLTNQPRIEPVVREYMEACPGESIRLSSLDFV